MHRISRLARLLKHPRRGDDADQALQIEVMRDQIIRQRLHARRERSFEWDVVHRRDERTVEQQRPDAVYERAGEGLVFLRRHPVCQPCARRALLRQQFWLPWNHRWHGFFLRFAEVAEFVALLRVIAQACQRKVRLAEVSGQLVEIRLLPGAAELSIMALHTVHLHTEKGAAHTGGQFCLVGAFFVHVRHRDEIHLWAGRPHALCIDQRAGDLIVRLVFLQSLAQPLHQPPAAVDQKRPGFDAHIDAHESLGEIVARSTIREQLGEPPLRDVHALHRLQCSNFLQRCNAARQRQRQATNEREGIRFWRRLDLFWCP